MSGNRLPSRESQNFGGGLRRFPKALSLTKPKLYQRAWTYTSLATAQPSCWNGWVWASFQLSHHCDRLKIKYVLAFFTLFNHIRCLRLQRKSSWNMLKPSANTLLPQANHPFLHMVPSSLGLGSSFALALGCSLMKADESWHENTPIDVWVWVKTRPKRLSWHAHLLVPKVCDV